MSAQHTPGPWNSISHNWHETSIYSGAIERRVCKLDTEDWGVDEDTEDEFGQIQEANARLIAAAPDLVAALKPFADAYAAWNGGKAREHFSNAVVPADFARAATAFAKATGAK